MANTQIQAGNEKQTKRKHPCGGYYISRKERKEHFSQAITFLKFFATSATSACGNKTSVWWLYVSRKERRERGGLVPCCSR